MYSVTQPFMLMSFHRHLWCYEPFAFVFVETHVSKPKHLLFPFHFSCYFCCKQIANISRLCKKVMCLYQTRIQKEWGSEIQSFPQFKTRIFCNPTSFWPLVRISDPHCNINHPNSRLPYTKFIQKMDFSCSDFECLTEIQAHIGPVSLTSGL